MTSDQFYDEANGFTKKTHRRIYGIWYGMLLRCSDPRNEAWDRYGGRGITACEEWQSFPVFLAWVRNSNYQDKLSLDRTDNEKGYSPSNCEWKTAKQQCRNTRRNLFVTAWGETKTLAEWIEDKRCKVGYGTARGRIVQRGVHPEKALSDPEPMLKEVLLTAWGETKSITDWARDPRCKVGRTGLQRRLQHGEKLEGALLDRPVSGNPRHGITVTAWGETKSLPEWIRDPRCVARYPTAFYRIVVLKMNAEEALSTPRLQKVRVGTSRYELKKYQRSVVPLPANNPDAGTT
jgi:hypothetical protein